MIKSEFREWIEAILIALVVAFIIRGFVMEPFIVEGDSMLDTLHQGERLIISKIHYRISDPHRGEILVFEYPKNPRLNYIKRIIGEPGDEVFINDGTVYINGKGLKEPYIAEPTYGTFGPAVVPPLHYFVMGDNRNNSKDSRHPDVGFIHISRIKGKALLRIWPIGEIGLISR